MKAVTHCSDKRRARVMRVMNTANAASAIGEPTPGCELFVLTHGQFSLIDALVYLSSKTGPVALSVCTWTAGDRDLTEMASLLGSGLFKSVRFLIDRSFITRQPGYCEQLRRLFGDDCIRTTRTHAKFCLLRNDKWNLAIRTSMNLNQNPRVENLEISDDPALCDFLEAQMNAHFDKASGSFDSPLLNQSRQSPIKTGTVCANRLYKS